MCWFSIFFPHRYIPLLPFVVCCSVDNSNSELLSLKICECVRDRARQDEIKLHRLPSVNKWKIRTCFLLQMSEKKRENENAEYVFRVWDFKCKIYNREWNDKSDMRQSKFSNWRMWKAPVFFDFMRLRDLIHCFELASWKIHEPNGMNRSYFFIFENEQWKDTLNL